MRRKKGRRQDCLSWEVAVSNRKVTLQRMSKAEQGPLTPATPHPHVRTVPGNLRGKRSARKPQTVTTETLTAMKKEVHSQGPSPFCTSLTSCVCSPGQPPYHSVCRWGSSTQGSGPLYVYLCDSIHCIGQLAVRCLCFHFYFCSGGCISECPG